MNRSWETKDTVWLLGSLCQLNKIPFDPALVTQQHPPPHTETTFTEAASALGFKVGRCDTTRRKLADLTFPFVAFLRDTDISTTVDTSVVSASAPVQAASTSATAEPTPPTAQLALVIKTDGDRLLYFRANNNTPETASVAEFDQRFEPVVLLAAHQAKVSTPDDDLWSRDPNKFGFRWFLPNS